MKVTFDPSAFENVPLETLRQQIEHNENHAVRLENTPSVGRFFFNDCQQIRVANLVLIDLYCERVSKLLDCFDEIYRNYLITQFIRG